MTRQTPSFKATDGEVLPRSPFALVSSSSSHDRNCLSLGISIFACAGVMVAVTPLNARLGGWGRKIQVEHMKYKDSRTKIVNEPPKYAFPMYL